MHPSTTRIDLHCHSDASDGHNTPKQLAAQLFARQVEYASLTDHDTVDSFPAFHRELEKYGIACICGVEVSASYAQQEVHVLAYGIDPLNPKLTALLEENRRMRSPGVSFFGRKNATNSSTQQGKEAAHTEIRQLFETLHQAGGKVFLAHPFILHKDPAELSRHLKQLKELGLDGIEALYKPYSTEEQETLVRLAHELDLCICGGSDDHGIEDPSSVGLGIDMPTNMWKEFRSLLTSNAESASGVAPLPTNPSAHQEHALWTPITLIIPTLLVIALFLLANFALIIPSFEYHLLARKKEMIRELTNSACSVLADLEKKVQTGELPDADAKAVALERIRAMRYGAQGKDYFWITDLQQTMLMHPYRKDLENQDVSDYADPNGVLLFREFSKMARLHGQGYVKYVWQKKDDIGRLAPKESYIKLFEPWGWIVGTGIYHDDVQAEIGKLSTRIANISFTIILLTAGLLAYVVVRSIRAESARLHAEEHLLTSHEKYAALAAASGDGVLMLLGGRCSYHNAIMREMLDYTEQELSLLRIEDLLPHGVPLAEEFSRPTPPFETFLRRKDGSCFEALVTRTEISLPTREGIILAIRDISSHRQLSEQLNESRDQYEELAESISAHRKAELQQKRLMGELQTGMLFLHQPVQKYATGMIRCPGTLSVQNAAEKMKAAGVDVAAVVSDVDAVIGIVTARDLAYRGIANAVDSRSEVQSIMSAPVISVAEDTPVYAAILLMQEHNIGHIAVHTTNRSIQSILNYRDLMQFENASATILSLGISRSGTIEELRKCRKRLPQLVCALIESGARSRHIAHAIAGISDNLLDRLLAFAQNELGPPPVSFCFLALGSEGRLEQTLVTDQDNAIIYEDITPDRADVAHAYFSTLGKIVCDGMNALGYPYCKAGMMAMNPQWCQPLSVWKKYFSEWIHTDDPKDFLDINIFFDFRAVGGEDSLALHLRHHIQQVAQNRAAFFHHFAKTILLYKPPLGIFGNIKVKTTRNDHRYFDTKEAMTPIVNFARLYALRNDIEETNTLDRLERLSTEEHLPAVLCQELATAYDFLLRLRFRSQHHAVQNNQSAGNQIDLKRLPHIEESTLQQTLEQIASMQQRIRNDFGIEGL